MWHCLSNSVTQAAFFPFRQHGQHDLQVAKLMISICSTCKIWSLTETENTSLIKSAFHVNKCSILKWCLVRIFHTLLGKYDLPHISIIYNQYVKVEMTAFWLITRWHIKQRSPAGRGPWASHLTTLTGVNHQFREALLAAQRAKSNMSVLAQMTLSKELISAIRCIDEGNEMQPLGFWAYCQICSELFNHYKTFLFERSFLTSVHAHGQKNKKGPLILRRKFKLPQKGVHSPLNARRRSKDSVFRWTAEVPHASHRPIVFTARLVQLDAQPESCTERLEISKLGKLTRDAF